MDGRNVVYCLLNFGKCSYSVVFVWLIKVLIKLCWIFSEMVREGGKSYCALHSFYLFYVLKHNYCTNTFPVFPQRYSETDAIIPQRLHSQKYFDRWQKYRSLKTKPYFHICSRLHANLWGGGKFLITVVSEHLSGDRDAVCGAWQNWRWQRRAAEPRSRERLSVAFYGFYAYLMAPP